MENQKIRKFSKNSQKNNSETVTQGNDTEMPKEISKEKYIYISRRKKFFKKIIDNLTSIVIV